MTTKVVSRIAPSVDLGVFIGRFQPFHPGHLHVVETALSRCRFLTILVGSSGRPRDYFNPFSFDERREMILDSIPENLRDRVYIQPIQDMTYNDGAWVTQVQWRVRMAETHFGVEGGTIGLVGHKKDGTSFYLNMFPAYQEIAVSNYGQLSATTVRDLFFALSDASIDMSQDAKQALLSARPMVTTAVMNFMEKFTRLDDYANLVEEYRYVQKYKSQFDGLAYPPIFQTVDSVVIQSGHVLLVKRRSRPGRGLWALPGGFLNATERVQDAAYRELREETKIKVPEAILRGCTVTSRLFDDVHRSARGRTLTHAFLIKLPDGPLSKVKGADDAEKAVWVPLADLRADTLFEDHYAIIKNLTAIL